MQITFESGIEHTDFDSVTKWLRETHWSPGITKEEVVFGARNSSLVVGGFDERGNQVSYLRVVSDRVRFAYILDVIVDPALRKQGIGTRMVDFALKCREMSLVYQWLLRTTDAHGVYAKLGFAGLDTPEEWMIIQQPRANRSRFP